MIRVLIVDDHAVVRRGLRAVLAHHADIDVVADAASGEEAVELTTALEPDVILMDISMPGVNGLEATRQIVSKSPGSRVLVLTSSARQEHIVGALEAGATGYILKDAAPDDLLFRIRSLVERYGER